MTICSDRMADYLLGGESGDVLFEKDFLNFEYESQSSFCRNDCQKKPCNLDTFECQIGRINGAFEFMIFRMIWMYPPSDVCKGPKALPSHIDNI